MTDAPELEHELSELARRLGQRGGRQTKQRGSEYFARIGRLGAQKRWHSGDANPGATKQSDGETDHDR
jgi:hypothetical protein